MQTKYTASHQPPMEFEACICDMTDDGRGIVKYQSLVIFTDRGLIGDTVRLRITKNHSRYYEAKVTQVVSRTPFFCKSSCTVCDRCGGCTISEIQYDEQCKIKENLVYQKIKRAVPTMPFTMQACVKAKNPNHYRNNIQLKLQWHTPQITLGFYAKKTHSVVPIHSCVLLPPIMREAYDALVRFFQESISDCTYSPATKNGYVQDELQSIDEIVLRTNEKENELLLILKSARCVNIETLNADHKHAFYTLCEQCRITSVFLQGASCSPQCIYGKSYVDVWLLGTHYHIAANAFFQVNYTQAAQLFSLAKTKLNLCAEDIVVDLYCGVGALSLIIAPHVASVLGIEVAPAAVESAQHNAKLNGVTNTRFLCGKVEDIFTNHFVKQKHINNAKIVIDPPRSGIEKKALAVIAQTKAPTLLYISCNPATLARDVAVLCDSGYTLTEITPVDLFPHTLHIETIAVLQFSP